MPDDLDNLRTLDANTPRPGDWGWTTGDFGGGDNAGLGRVDRYELLGKCGRGGFGMVFRARDTVADIVVAMKVLPPELAHDAAELENVRKNFVLIKGLSHPHIASVDYLHQVQEADEAALALLGASPGDYLVIMEFVPGASLAERPDEPMPVGQATDVCAQIADALDYAHWQGIIHRDIKPGNIQIGPGGQVKVLDFGLAAEIRHSLSVLSHDTAGSSGTRPYMAPEQWRGEAQKAATDQYALAALFHELVSGRVPLQGIFVSNDGDIMRGAVLNEMPPPLAELDKKENRALSRALAKDPAARFPSCAQFVAALRGERVGAAPSWGKALAVAGLVVLLAAIAAVVYVFRPPTVSLPPQRVSVPPPPEPPRASAPSVAPKVADAAPSTPVLRPPVAPRTTPPPPVAVVPRPAPVTTPTSRPAEFIRLDDMLGKSLVAVTDYADAPLEGLAPGSREAQERQRQWAAKMGVPLEIRTKKTGIVLRLVPPGSFTMGSPGDEPGRYKSEALHRVTLTQPIYMGRYEITQAQYEMVMGNNPSQCTQAGKNAPVDTISWNDARQFLVKLAQIEQVPPSYFRLPTEAEWEYACRAGTRTAFCFFGGFETLHKFGNYCERSCIDNPRYQDKNYDDGHVQSSPVGSFRGNAWGLHDMHGNIWEWCSDFSDKPYPPGDAIDPQGPERSGKKVTRGGGWNHLARNCRSAYRGGRGRSGSVKDRGIGVRIVFSRSRPR